LQSTQINDPRVLSKRASHNAKYFSNSTTGLNMTSGFDIDFLAHGGGAASAVNKNNLDKPRL
jgi:hypothetical protein